MPTRIISQLRNSTLLRHNTVFFVGSLSMGALNYLYYPVLGHLLHPSTFGEVQVLASLFAQVMIFLNVLGLLTVNIVVNYSDERKRNRLIAELEKLALLISSALLLLSVLGGPALKHFFRFDSAVPFAVLILAVVVSVPLTFRSAYLRGRQRFGLVSLIGMVSSASDLILAAAFVYFGWGTTGAIAGLVAGQAIALGYAAWHSQRQGFTESLRGSLVRLPDMRLLLPELRYAGLVLVCSLTITGLYSLDTIVIKHYFDAHTAGLYAGISTVARIVFFLTASVAQVLLPSIKIQHTARQNLRTLIQSALLLMAVGGVALAVFGAMPRFIIRVLMGGAYLPYSNLLPWLSLAVFIISVLNLFIMYHLALRHYWIALIAIIGFAVTLGLLRTYHTTPMAVIDSLIYGSLTTLALLGVWVSVAKHKKSSIRITAV